MAQDNIQSTLHENRTFPPSDSFVNTAALSADKLNTLYQQAGKDHTAFWSQQAKQEIDWQQDFETVVDDTNAPFYRWFPDGKLNVSYNCLDRHLTDRGDKTAIIFEGEPGDTQHISYRELHQKVCTFANALKAQGIQKSDRVIIYMPMIAEAVVAMQACARIGAIHSVVFGGFSAQSLKDRIEDTGAKMVITADGGHRSGKIIELKATTDDALNKGCPSVETVIVFKRTGHDINMLANRDIWWSEAEQRQPAVCEPEWVNADHPLFLLYTSGSTGKPKGIQHGTGGYLLNAITSMRWVFDIQDSDVFWCTADVGWITGHTYVAYGPLATGATILIYEGVPTVPDAGRFWDICQRHQATIFYTAPTAIRALMKIGDEYPNRYDLSKLRLLGTVGEPINPEAWMWYHNVIGQQRCPIVDTWWQTETGAHMIAPVPASTITKPGSCTRALPGIDAAIVNQQGEEITEANEGGYLVIRQPWPSMIQTVWGDDQRYKDTYWPYFNGKYYLAGDSARRDKDGYFWIMGRIDDVLNVSGHRLGTMEIESALVAHKNVAEAAVVGQPHDIKGESIFAYVVLKGERPPGGIDNDLTNELRQWVGTQIGAIAKPDNIRYADNLPKTRSGKIMRRLLRTIAKGDEITQDTSTLENEGILPQLQGKT
jgi:acetyl-CoA synthetase